MGLIMKTTKELLIEILVKYYDITRPLDESLRSLIGDYSNDIKLRAIRNVVFEKQEVTFKGRNTAIWCLKPWEVEVPGERDDEWGINFLVSKVDEEYVKLKKLIYNKNNFIKNPPKPAFVSDTKIEFFKSKPVAQKPSDFYTLDEFKVKYAKMASEELLARIYWAIYSSYFEGYREGYHAGYTEMEDKIGLNRKVSEIHLMPYEYQF